jgi:hypothetical protein
LLAHRPFGPVRIGQPDLNDAHALLPDTEEVLVGVSIDTQTNVLAHLAEFDVPDLLLFDPVNELADRSPGDRSARMFRAEPKLGSRPLKTTST